MLSAVPCRTCRGRDAKPWNNSKVCQNMDSHSSRDQSLDGALCCWAGWDRSLYRDCVNKNSNSIHVDDPGGLRL